MSPGFLAVVSAVTVVPKSDNKSAITVSAWLGRIPRAGSDPEKELVALCLARPSGESPRSSGLKQQGNINIAGPGGK